MVHCAGCGDLQNYLLGLSLILWAHMTYAKNNICLWNAENAFVAMIRSFVWAQLASVHHSRPQAGSVPVPSPELMPQISALASAPWLTSTDCRTQWLVRVRDAPIWISQWRKTQIQPFCIKDAHYLANSWMMPMKEYFIVLVNLRSQPKWKIRSQSASMVALNNGPIFYFRFLGAVHELIRRY